MTDLAVLGPRGHEARFYFSDTSLLETPKRKHTPTPQNWAFK